MASMRFPFLFWKKGSQNSKLHKRRRFVEFLDAIGIPSNLLYFRLPSFFSYAKAYLYRIRRERPLS